MRRLKTTLVAPLSDFCLSRDCSLERRSATRSTFSKLSGLRARMGERTMECEEEEPGDEHVDELSEEASEGTSRVVEEEALHRVEEVDEDVGAAAVAIA